MCCVIVAPVKERQMVEIVGGLKDVSRKDDYKRVRRCVTLSKRVVTLSTFSVSVSANVGLWQHTVAATSTMKHAMFK